MHPCRYKQILYSLILLLGTISPNIPSSPFQSNIYCVQMNRPFVHIPQYIMIGSQYPGRSTNLCSILQLSQRSHILAANLINVNPGICPKQSNQHIQWGYFAKIFMFCVIKSPDTQYCITVYTLNTIYRFGKISVT